MGRSLNVAKCPILHPIPSPHPASNKEKFGGVHSMSGETLKSWLNICNYRKDCGAVTQCG